MFGFGKKSSKSTENVTSDDFNVDALLAGISQLNIHKTESNDQDALQSFLMPGSEHDLTEADLNDPSLLNELAQLAQSEGIALRETKEMKPVSGAKVKVTSPLIVPATTPPVTQLAEVSDHNDAYDYAAQIATSIAQADDDLEMEPFDDEKDMNNPELLRDLSLLTGANETVVESDPIRPIIAQENMKIMEPSSKSIEAIKSIESSKSIEAMKSIESSKSMESSKDINENDDLAFQQKCQSATTADQLTALIREAKVRAVQMKRNGASSDRTKQALTLVRQLESQLNEISSNSIATTQNATVIPPRKSSVKLNSIPSGSTPTLAQYESRLNEYRQAALDAKNRGDLATAKQLLSIYGPLQATVQKMRSGSVADMALPSAPTTSTANKTVATAKQTNTTTKQGKTVTNINTNTNTNTNANLGNSVTPTSNVNKLPKSSTKNELKTISEPLPVIGNNSNPLEAYESLIKHLIDTLEAQLATATNVAARALQLKDKTTALQFHKYRKQFTQDMTALKAALITATANNQVPSAMPLYHYVAVDYSYIKQCDDIPLNQCRIQVHAIRDLPETDMDTFVKWIWPWPEEAGTTGQSPVVKTRNTLHAQYDYKVMLPLERNKATLRALDRRKWTAEVWQTGRGLFRSNLLLGRVTVPLQSLATQCESECTVPLMQDGTRRPTGALMDVSVSVRQPLNGPEMVKQSEQWLFMDGISKTEPEVVASKSIATISSPETESAQTHVSSEKVSSPSSNGQQKANISSNPQSNIVQSNANATDQSNTNSEEEKDEAEQQFNDAMKIVSNLVLERETTQCEQQLATCRIATQREHLTDRIQSLQIKMNMLVIQVQTGQLTIPDYVNQLKEAIQSEKSRAVQFKQRGWMELARRALFRVRTMQEEVDELQSAPTE